MPEKPLPPPPMHPDEPPFYCIQINQSWIPYIIGLLRPAKFPEYWSGTLEENRNARRDVQNLIYQLQDTEGCTDMQECCEPVIYIYRINIETGRWERSPDNGENWIPDPQDPIFHTVEQPPIVRGTTAALKCDASTNALEHIEDIIVETSEQIGTATSIFELAAGIAAFLLEVAIIIITGGAGSALALAIAAAIWTAASGALEAGKTAFDDYWTNERKDQILCALYCTIGDNGQWSDGQFNSFIHKVKHDLTPHPALDMIVVSIKAMGRPGLNNMASYGAAAGADCADCEEDCPPEACNWNSWAAYDSNTEVLEKDSTHIKVRAFQGNPTTWEARIVSNADDNCCCGITIDMGGVLPSVIGFVACGDDRMNLDNVQFSYFDDAANHYVINAHEPFDVIITSSGPC